jgi:cytochrome c551/c552
MKNPLLVLSLTVGLVVGLCGATLAADKKDSSKASSKLATAKMEVTPHFKPTGKPVSTARGEIIFVDHCALCHGLHGRGDGPRSAFFQPGVQFIPDFATPGYLTGRDEQLLKSVREGLARLPEPAILMPQFKYILSDDEIRSVLVYLKTLAVKPMKTADLAVVSGDTGEQLAQKYNCLVCHQAGSKVVGPSYRDVASKYRGQPGAVAAIAEKIRKGSTGNWGDIPMPPKAEVTAPDMKKIVEWILSIT